MCNFDRILQPAEMVSEWSAMPAISTPTPPPLHFSSDDCVKCFKALYWAQVEQWTLTNLSSRESVG
jgi:hypothetical protein